MVRQKNGCADPRRELLLLDVWAKKKTPGSSIRCHVDGFLGAKYGEYAKVFR